MTRKIILAGMAWAAGALFSLQPAVATAAPALHVEESAVFDAPPAAVWKVVGVFYSAGWHPAVAETTIIQGKDNHKGAVRNIKTRDGAVFIEKLLARDARTLRLRYQILQSPLPVSAYVSEIQVLPEGRGSRVVWKSDFEAMRSAEMDDVKARDIVAGIYTGGFEGLREKLAGQ
jgi:mxaD protein